MTLRRLVTSITRLEWLFVGLVSVAAMVITSLPELYGFIVTPPGKIFTAMHFVSADDWFVYYSFINQVKQGSWLFADLYSNLPHVAVFRPEWLAVGLLARIFNLSAPLAFHLARVLLIPIFFTVAYVYLAYLFPETTRRKFALFFLSCSSGLGWLFIYRLVVYPQNFANGFFHWPMDLWVPDINTFLTLFTSPHFIAATTLILGIFLLTSLFVENPKYGYAVWSGLLGLALFSFHPFQVLKMLVILLIFLAMITLVNKKLNWHHLAYGLIFGLISAPAVLYYVWLLRVDQLTLLRTIQNINPTTPLYITLISFGGLLVLAGYGVFWLDKKNKLLEPKFLLISLWAAVQLVLLYAPVSYQRRLALGIHFPLVVLSVVGLSALYVAYGEKIKTKLVEISVILFIIFVPSSLFALAADVMVFSQNREASYLDQDAYNAFQWLNKNSPRSAVIFSSTRVGNIIPAYAVRTSYVGHAVETPYFVERKLEPGWFFDHNRSPEVERQFLVKRGVTYLLFGPDEQEFGSYQPSGKPYLQLVFSSDTVNVYQVQ